MTRGNGDDDSCSSAGRSTKAEMESFADLETQEISRFFSGSTEEMWSHIVNKCFITGFCQLANYTPREMPSPALGGSEKEKNNKIKRKGINQSDRIKKRTCCRPTKCGIMNINK